MKFGARTLKTGLSVVLAIYIAKIFHLSPEIYAAVAASLTVMPSLYRSWRHVIEQVKSNLIGATIALVTLLLIHQPEPWIVGIVIVIAISINLSLGFEKSIGIVVLTIIAILEAPQAAQGDDYLFVLNRFLLILVGITSSVFINAVFIPPNYQKRLIENIRRVNEDGTRLMKMIMMGNIEENVYKKEKEKLMKDIERTKEVYLLFKEDFSNKLRKPKYTDARKLVVFRELTNNLDKSYLLVKTIENHYFYKRELFSDELQKNIESHLHELLEYKERILLKLDKKIKSAQRHERDEHLFNNTTTLVNQIIEIYKVKDISDWHHGLPMVSALIEFTHELNHLDQLVDSLNSKHNNE
ncbi:aromatic acid exporter family protein [Priestia filamentosa]|uniref:FUSC family protein n=1 Tax=Priestia filamentosa TaxID=1402861 RepID=UPI00397E46E0